MSLLVRFKDRDFDESLALAGIAAGAESLTWNAQGGPEDAVLAVSGPELALWQLDGILRYAVEVVNDLGESIWWGYVHGVEFQKGAIRFGLSLDRMSNSVAVAYSTVDGETGRTAYAADAESVATYGTKQLLVSADNMTVAAAERRRATELNRRRLPIVSPPVNVGGGDGKLSVMLECRGWLDTLAWPYYSRDEGWLAYLPSSGQGQKIGLGSTGTGFGFLSGVRQVVSLGGRFGNLRKGDTFRISGSVSNNGVYTVEQGTEREAIAYAASTISFDAATREVRDSANGVGTFDAHDVVLVSGSAANDGSYRIESASADGSKFVVVGSLVNEAAGASITLYRGHGVSVEEALVEELPGATVTWTALGTMVAQSFEVTSTDAWTVATAAVQVRKVGSPADSLQIAIYSDTAGSPGTLLDSATVAGSTLSTESDWVTVDLANTLSLVPGTTYWLVVSRTGAISASDYYEVSVDEDLGYAPEVMELYDGTAWVARPVAANLPFRLTGLEDTNTQIEKIIGTAGEFIVRNEVDASGVETNQWRYGDNTALVELENLLNLGTSNDRRMLATVTRERTLIVAEEPTIPDPVVYFQRADGMLVDRHNQPLLEVYPPVGQWVDLKGVIPDAVQVSELLRPGPYLLERAEYNVKRQEWRLDARDAGDVWEMAGIREG